MKNVTGSTILATVVPINRDYQLNIPYSKIVLNLVDDSTINLDQKVDVL